MASLKSSLSANLIRILDEKGLSQSELARGVKISVKTVNGLINKKAGISGLMITKLASFLKVDETELVQDQKVIEKIDALSAVQVAREIAVEAVKQAQKQWFENESAAAASPTARGIVDALSALDEAQLGDVQGFIERSFLDSKPELTGRSKKSS